MVEDNPRMNELESLAAFCNTHARIYIYGHDWPQRLLGKYLVMAGLNFTGYIMAEVPPEEQCGEPFPIINILSIPKLHWWERGRSVGVLLSIEDTRLTQVVDMLHKVGLSQLYFLSDWNKRTIPYKMTPRSKENFWLEVNLADHCNLNCQCCDHFSPLAKPTFLDFEQYVRDINRLAELTDHHIGMMKLQGGEPLLNDHLIDFIRVTREVFPETLVCMFTDGLLLAKWGRKKDKENLWKAVKDYEIEVRVTRYPISLDIEAVKEQLAGFGIPFTQDPPPFKKGTRVWYFSEIGALEYRGEKHSVKHPFDLSGRQEAFRFISCYQFNESIVLRDGKIYTCPMIPYVHYFNEAFGQNLKVCERDYIDIYKAESYAEIAEFCTHRVPFCRYCAVQCRSVRDWRQSQHSIEEWIL